MIKLSILIPSTNSRWDNFNIEIQRQLFSQYNELKPSQQKEVEILMLVDTKSQMLGEKRNNMLFLAKGEYVVFVDSDDRVSPDYISTLLDATRHGSDVITFNASVSLNGGDPKICVYSTEFTHDHNTETQYNRIPNHICCFKRSLAIQFPFPNILYGEDSGFSKSIKNAIKTQHRIDRVLYCYDYNQETTETQYHIGSNSNAVIDIVILSNASTLGFKRLTDQAINTAFSTAGSNAINVIVVEQQNNVVYPKAKTVHISGEFNYNKFANIGASHGSARYILVSNNDVVFSKGWLDELIDNGGDLMGTRCPRDVRQRSLTGDEQGDVIGRNFSGWCFAISRKLWLDINGFDEDFNFYCADNSVVEQCREKGVLPTVVYQSVVQHIGSQTLRTVKDKDPLTWECVDRFNKKYNKDLFKDNKQFQLWKQKR